jgi:hypothetical protein
MCLSVPHSTKPFTADLALIRTLSLRYCDGARGTLRASAIITVCAVKGRSSHACGWCCVAVLIIDVSRFDWTFLLFNELFVTLQYLRPCSAFNALQGNAVQVLFVHLCWCLLREQHERNSNKDIVHIHCLLTSHFFVFFDKFL